MFWYVFSRVQGCSRQAPLTIIFGRALRYVLESFSKIENQPPRHCSSFYWRTGTRAKHKDRQHQAGQFSREPRTRNCLQAGRARHKIWVHSPQYSTTKWTAWTQFLLRFIGVCAPWLTPWQSKVPTLCGRKQLIRLQMWTTWYVIHPGESKKFFQKIYRDKKRCFAVGDYGTSGPSLFANITLYKI